MCKTLNYFERFFVFISAVSSCVWISAFALLLGIPISITSSEVELKICAIAAGNKNYKSINKKNKKKNNKLVFLGKDKSNTIKVLISKTLIFSDINHDEFASVNNRLRKHKAMKKN